MSPACSVGEKEESAGWLGYIADHAGSSEHARGKANHLLDELASQLSPQAMAAARERYTDRTLEEVVQAVLQKL